MDKVNSQESIIALLQGELTDRIALNRLLESLVGSTEGQDTLLKQISLMHRMRALGASITPALAADTRIFEEIARIEQRRDVAGSRARPQSDRRFRPVWWIVAGILAALLAGSGGGYFIGIQRNAGGGQPHVGEGSALSGIDPSSAKSDPMPRQSATPPVTSARTKPAPRFPSSSATVEKNGIRRRVDADALRARPLGSAVGGVNLPSQDRDGPLRVLSPNGAEVFDVGNTVPIRWSGKADSTPVVVQFSDNGGQDWNIIGKNVVGGELLWKIPQSSGNAQYLVKVSQDNSAGLIPKFRQQLPHDTTLNIASFSPDGALLAVPDYAGTITVWDVASWKPIRKLTGHARSVIQVVFSPDGASLVSTSLDGTVRMWNVMEGKEIHQTTGKGKVLQVSWVAAYHPNGKTVALGNDDGTITLWDAATGDEVLTFDAHTEAIRSLYYSHDGNLLATCGTDGRAGIFNSQSGEAVQTFAGHDGIANGITMSRDGTLVITCGFDGTVKFWDVNSGRLIRAVQYFGGDKIGKVLLSPDGTILAVGGFGKDLKLVDPATGEVLETLPITVHNRALGAWPVFSPDSRTLAVCHENDLLLWEMSVNSDVSDAVWEIR